MFCSTVIGWNQENEKMGKPRPPFRFLFSSFQTNIQFLQQISVKSVHLVSGAGIQTHSLLITSLLPLPLDQGSHPGIKKVTTRL